MLTGLYIIVFVCILVILSHRRSKLENKVLKNVALYDWLVVLVFPVLLYIGWIFIIRNIVMRPRVDILPFDDFDIFAVTVVFMVYGMVGNSIHFTSKILSRYLTKSHKMAYQLNEMFHGKLSHYLVFLNGLFIFFMLPVLEVNHPAQDTLTRNYMSLMILAGIIVGIFASKGIFYTNEWFGGYNKPLFFLTATLLCLLVSFFQLNNLKSTEYPIYVFITSFFISFISTFIFRQLFIFTRLGKKRRWRFLAKALSA